MTVTATQRQFDAARAEAFGGRMLSILGGGLLSSMVDIGHRTALFAAAAEGPATSQQLAARAGLTERYVREWLGAVTTGGIFDYNVADDTYALPPEHAALLTGPTSMGGAGGSKPPNTAPATSTLRICSGRCSSRDSTRPRTDCGTRPGPPRQCAVPPMVRPRLR